MSESIRLKILSFLVEIEVKIKRSSCNEFLEFLSANYPKKLAALNRKSNAIISEECGYPVDNVLTMEYKKGDNDDVALCISLIPELLKAFNDFISIWDLEKLEVSKNESQIIHYDIPEIPKVEILSDKEALKAWGLAEDEDEEEEDTASSAAISMDASLAISVSTSASPASATSPVTHVNLDKKYLPKPGRKGELLSEADLLDKISKAQGSPVLSTDYDINMYTLMGNCPKLASDIEKICFDMENIDYKGDGFGTLDMCGYHVIDDKFSYIGVYAGGDWELPLMFIIYYDGHELRVYVPTCGNSFNADMKTAFGSEGENKLSSSQLEKLVKKYGYANADEMLDLFKGADISERYCTVQGANFDTIQPSLEHIIEDIKARFSL